MEGSMSFQELSIRETVFNRGVSRRDFLKFCSVMAGALALPKSGAAWIEAALTAPKRVPVVWLELQDCAGCSEAFLRSNNPSAADIILDVLSVDYHETIMAAAGKQAEEAKAATIKAGGYILVVEGSVSLGDNGVYCCIGGRSSEDLIREAASNAVAVVAVGNCAAFGGIPKAKPNPTQAVGVMDIITDKPVLNIPGCPLNPVNLTATVVHYLTFGALPEMDKLHRPLFAFGQLIHDNCERRGHFDAGEFVRTWGDAGHRAGWCLYQMGCKGPVSSHNCSIVKYNDGTNWPIGAGHPCIGCSEPDFWDMATYTPIQLNDFLPPSTYPAVGEVKGTATPEGAAVTAGAVGVVAGAALAFGYTVMTGRAKGVTPEVSQEEPSEEGHEHH
ncbi:MAG TPA: [Ni/Fe] hydrogenase small subunit [Anaerolineaceae bacterium]|nr:[Ni/Fe] hydrogenase small subunit [Anaerolineaceae bacterium]